MLFSRAKRSSKKSDFEKYKQMRNRVVSQIHEAKSRFFKSINPRDAKKFWKAVKYLNKNCSQIPVLASANVSARSAGEKAEMLNGFFSTWAVPPLSPSTYSLGSDSTIFEDLLCTDEEIYFFLSSLDTNKATGPDGISAQMLKATAGSIAPSVTKLLNLSLSTGCVPDEWKR